MNDISPDFRPSKLDAEIFARILPHEATPKAIRTFNCVYRPLSDYGYWFMLGTLWVSYTGHSDLELWKRLLRSPRPNRDTSLMKPSELNAWRALPEVLTLYRAHRLGEADWIAYTLNPDIAARFALEREVREVTEYRVNKSDALCLFLRRGEEEVLVLDRTKARFVRVMDIVLRPMDAEALATAGL